MGETELQTKALYLALVVRRLMAVRRAATRLDDKDYYGNKRVELSVHLLELLFEDKFKGFNVFLEDDPRALRQLGGAQDGVLRQRRAATAAAARRLPPLGWHQVRASG